MIKQTVINAQLAQALALARHKDAIVICDANMPIPAGCNLVDVSLMRGVPTLLETLKAILNDFVAERYQVFELMPQYNPAMLAAIQEEVHRFTVSRMTEAKRKTLRTSSLEKIGGIGPKKAKLLLSHFGSLAKIGDASEEELCEPKGISANDAKRIYEYFHGGGKADDTDADAAAGEAGGTD